MKKENINIMKIYKCELLLKEKNFFDELIVGKKFKKESIIIKIMEFYVYLACIFIIYKLIKYYH